MITAVVIMLILELLQVYNDYLEVQESGITINQFRVVEYVLHFTVIFTVAILFFINKNKMKETSSLVMSKA